MTTQHFSKFIFHILNKIWVQSDTIHFSFIEDVCFPGTTSILHIDQINLRLYSEPQAQKSINAFSYLQRKSLIYYRRRILSLSKRTNSSCYLFDHVMTKYSDENLKRCCRMSAFCQRPHDWDHHFIRRLLLVVRWWMTGWQMFQEVAHW